jgi:Zn ribbon nucleic-acid-binding protein
MGSVISYVDCPNCGQECYDDYYYKTNESYVNCGNCGYHHSVTLSDVEKNWEDITQDDYIITEIKNPYGSYKYKYIGDVATIFGSLENEEQAEEFKKEMISEQETIEFAQISRYVNGEFSIISLVESTK